MLFRSKYISESTLKRFLGFHDSGFAPSYDTIKILKEFISMSKQKKTESSVSMENFVLDFFNPLHFENIKKEDKGFLAACRSIALLLRNNKSLFEKVMTPLAQVKTGLQNDAKKNLKHIKPDRFYFITKSYYEKLYKELVESLKRN